MGFPIKITSVDGQTGTVDLTKSDVGLGNVDNTSDVNKPVSTAQLTAIQARSNAVVSTTWANRATAIAAIAASTPGTGWVRVTDVGVNGSLWWCNGSTLTSDSTIVVISKAVGWLVPSLLAANLATYSQTGTTITVTSAGHNIPATTFEGYNVYLVIGSGAAVTGWFTNFTRVDANTFTCVSTVSQSTSGAVNTNTAATTITPVTYTIPANLLGLNGQITTTEEFSYFNSANNKTLAKKIGAVTVTSSARTTTSHDSWTSRFKNKNSLTLNSYFVVSESSTTTSTPQILPNVDTSTNLDYTIVLTSGTASEYAALSAIFVEIDPVN